MWHTTPEQNIHYRTESSLLIFDFTFILPDPILIEIVASVTNLTNPCFRLNFKNATLDYKRDSDVRLLCSRQRWEEITESDPELRHPPPWHPSPSMLEDRQTDTDIRLSRSHPNLTRIEVFTVFNAQIISGCPHLKTPRRKKRAHWLRTARAGISGGQIASAPPPPQNTHTHTSFFLCNFLFNHDWAAQTQPLWCKACPPTHTPTLYYLFLKMKDSTPLNRHDAEFNF